jgi:septal ring factor EnvC (AmiA/AmiB activator)
MQELQAEIAAIRSQIDSLRRELDSIIINVVPPKNESPQAIAEAYRRYARENPLLSAEVKGIDDAIAALQSQLHQKQAQLHRFLTDAKQLSIEEQLEEARTQAKVHAERINQLAGELASEIRVLKACADKLSPMYWQVYYKPFITGFKTISVPHVRSDGDVWTIVNRIV